MTTSSTVLIQSKYAPNTQTTEYTTPSNTKTIIDKFTVSNDSGGGVSFAVNIVDSGGSAGASNLILPTKTIADGETYECPELIGRRLNAGDFISLIAGAASSLVIRAEGREIT